MLELVRNKPKGVKNEHIKNLISLPLLEAMKEIRCGFELETQSLDGKNWCQLSRHYGYSNDAAIRDLFGNINKLCVKQDCSVKGPEIATIGPLTVKEFMERLKIVTAAEFVSDPRCSFHIHMSVDGVSHRYGQLFQNWMMEYMLMRYESFPDWLKERFRYGYRNQSYWFDRYYAPRLSQDRFAMIAYRGRTWEFRFFGNVNSYQEGLYCLNLAIRALRYAYLVKHKQVKPLLKGIVVKMNRVSLLNAIESYFKAGITKNELLALFAMKTTQTKAMEAMEKVNHIDTAIEQLRRAS